MALTQVPVTSADKFRGYFGTRIFPSYAGKTGGQLLTPEGEKWVTDLAPAFVSHKITPATGSDIVAFVNRLGSKGVKSVCTVGEPFTTYTDAQWAKMMEAVEACGDNLIMVTGQNEVNHIRGGGALPTDWPTRAAKHQSRLWTEMGSINSKRKAQGKNTILVGNPNLWSGDINKHNADLAKLAPLVKPYCNASCYHLYPRGGHPTWELDNFISRYRSVFGSDRPVWCTEAGYFEAVNYTGAAVNVTQWAHDIYIRKMWLEYAKRGCFVSQFEMLDDVDPANADREASFGLVDTPAVDSRWTAKPAYTNLRSMLSLRGGVDKTMELDISSTGPVSLYAVNHTDGDTLFVWREENIEKDMKRLPLSPVSVVVNGETYEVGADILRVDIIPKIEPEVPAAEDTESEKALKLLLRKNFPRASDVRIERATEEILPLLTQP